MSPGDSVALFSTELERIAPGLQLLDEGRIVAFREGRDIRACRNRCRHQGGRFALVRGALRCASHGWCLDGRTLHYRDPLGLQQPALRVRIRPDGIVEFRDPKPSAPWGADPLARAALQPGELEIRYLAHACAEFACGSARLISDPWLIGPAFSRGWWLAHAPPANWLERLVRADAIYISHNHSDHLHPPTLRPLARARPEIPIYVPAFESHSCTQMLEGIGFRDVRRTPFEHWIPLSSDARFMLLQDRSGRDDSGLLLEYRGWRILNTVDCNHLRDLDLPQVDVLMGAFAGGSSGYPVCWGEQYPAREIERRLRRNRQQLLRLVLRTVATVRPRVYIPFAGSFAEAHPADREIRALNLKNDPARVIAQVRSRFPDVQGWLPHSLGRFDVGRSLGTTARPGSGPPEHDFERFTRELRAALEFEPLHSLTGVERYFAWAGYKGDLILHVLETDEDFARVRRELFVDFRGPNVVAERPSGSAPYLRMRVRQDVFRHVLLHGLPWEEISIGFQARFYREPDVYHFDFWDHFQNALPGGRPDWEPAPACAPACAAPERAPC